MESRKFSLHPVIATAIAINVLTLVLALLWRNDEARLLNYLREDGLVEWMQFLCFTVLAGLLGFIAIERWKQHRRLALDVVALAGLSALLALVALEEVSWFQRVLEFGSPDFFAQHNRQTETNLHNMVVGDINLHKSIIVKIILIVGLTHNLILPLIALAKPAVKQWVESLGLYLPPLTAAFPYLALVVLGEVLMDHPRQGELSETFGALHYLATVFTAYLVGFNYGKPALIENPADRKRMTVLFSMLLVFLFFVAWLLGVGYNFKTPA